MASIAAARPGAIQMPPSNDFAATWAFLEEGINTIMLNLVEGMSSQRWMLLYTCVYNYCTAPSSASRMGRANMGGTNMVGGDLYVGVIGYFERRAKEIHKGAESLSDDTLLRYYATEWDRYTLGAQYVHHLFMYLNRYWVRREKDDGKRDVHTVYTLALVQWKEFMFKPVQSKGSLCNAVLKQAEKQRNGEIVDTSLLKKVADSFVLLGLRESDSRAVDLSVYDEHLERPFLQAASTYYTNESAAFLAENSVTDYMKKVEARLKEEVQRVEVYLHPSTGDKLLKRCDTVLIEAHKALLHETFQTLLDNEQREHLMRMYTLLSRVPALLQPLRDTFEAHVQRVGHQAVEKIAADGKDVDPTAYFNALLGVHSNNLGLVKECFADEAKFKAVLDRACQNFVNKNKATGTSSTKSPELLAKHADNLLKKGQKTFEEGELEIELDQLMTLFKYLSDRDVFQKFYTKNLARRLVHQQSASDDAELNMITKLKDACGYEYTSGLQRMFQDVNISKELNEEFKDLLGHRQEDAPANPIDFSVMVLTSGSWPMQPPTTKIALPTELHWYQEEFKRFYCSKKFQGRKLVYLWHLCKSEIKTNHLSQKYTFMTSAYQMSILTEFNAAERLTFQELAAATQLDDSIIKSNLVILTKSKVLLEEGGAYKVNKDFRNKKLRINLNVPIKAEQKAESTEVLKTVDEDRKLVIQATIVRIMKARKQLKHANLMQEVVQQVSSRFQPKIPVIKKEIDNLIDKEYLERAEGQKDLYSYVA
ncbi:Cullin-domain-containing protein [Tilletiaria anomala UBC 951]|uniref:Cullin-1 n=1 Tax=Tilletiaria anomala (strain ATCC 24038 / CBS 436.72 / UBC 951) TaxID=1037660 RepID=A0A066WN58_TILAU|nr:Cullin-domain-containing protein [Tilletiaria anomala UBC 951]KDN52065.1 Cullin-domain-containing protein [Tilletiaria anomala UBC 951]